MIRCRSRAAGAAPSAARSWAAGSFVSATAVIRSRYQGGWPSPASRLLLDLAQAPRLDLVDEAADGVLVRDEGTGLDPGDGLAHVALEVGERFQGERRPEPGVGLDLGLDLVVAERQHAAAGVVDEDDLGRPEQALGDGQGPDDVVGHHSAGVADHVRVALGEPEDAVGVEAGVHAGDHGAVLGGRHSVRRWQRTRRCYSRFLPGANDRVRAGSYPLSCLPNPDFKDLKAIFSGEGQLLSRRGNATSFSSSRMAAAIGIATSTPTM